jgi:branched-chain amino acid transport system substrate-binding protein
MVFFAVAGIFVACAPEPVHIGFVGPLTGSSSAIGLGVRNGFLMALSDGNGAATGKMPPHVLCVKDDHNDPDVCLEVFMDLKAGGCSIVVLGTTSQAATKAVPWAMQNGMLVITPTISNPVSGIDNTLFVRINLGSDLYGAALADLAMQRYGKTRVGITGDMINAGYTQSVLEAFTSLYTSMGGSVSFTRLFNSRTDKPTADLAGMVTGNRSDGLLVIAASTEVALIAKELEKTGVSVQLFLPPWPLTVDLLDNGGTAVEGAVAASVADLEFRTPAGKAFEQNYQDEYGEHPSFTAMFGFEAASILRSTLAETGAASPLAVRNKLIETGTYEGLQGLIQFDPLGNANRDIFFFKIEDGMFKSID